VCFIVVLVGARVGLKLWSIRIHDKLPFSIAMCMRFDCMATGALFALLYRTRERLRAWLAKSWVPPAMFWAVAALAATNHLQILSILGENVVALATGMFIIHEIEKGARTTLLENPVMSFLGKISYGIYVYHPLVIALLGIALAKSARTLPNMPVALACVASLTIVVSWLSYRFIEQPFLRRKQRFARIASGAP
jgi:peptidoglycan/LPS O-acetylase OafA/YrhL